MPTNIHIGVCACVCAFCNHGILQVTTVSIKADGLLCPRNMLHR